MRFPFLSARMSDDLRVEAQRTARVTLRSLARHGGGNPFARPVPGLLRGDPQRTAEVLRVF